MQKKHLSSAQLPAAPAIALSVAFLFFALLLALALFSYNPADPAWRHNNGGIVHNQLGSLGAWFSDLSFSLIGKLSYLLPLALVAFFVHVWREKQLDKELFSWRLFMLLTAVLSGCVLWAKHDTAVINTVAQTGGGAVGAWLAIGLEKSVKSVSVIMAFSAIIFAISVSLLFNIPWGRVADKIGSGILALFANIFGGVKGGNPLKKVAAPADEEADSSASNTALQDKIKFLNENAGKAKRGDNEDGASPTQADAKSGNDEEVASENEKTEPSFTIDRYQPEPYEEAPRPVATTATVETVTTEATATATTAPAPTAAAKTAVETAEPMSMTATAHTKHFDTDDDLKPIQLGNITRHHSKQDDQDSKANASLLDIAGLGRKSEKMVSFASLDTVDDKATKTEDTVTKSEPNFFDFSMSPVKSTDTPTETAQVAPQPIAEERSSAPLFTADSSLDMTPRETSSLSASFAPTDSLASTFASTATEQAGDSAFAEAIPEAIPAAKPKRVTETFVEKTQVIEPTPTPQVAQPQIVKPTPASQAAQPQVVEPTPAPQAVQPQVVEPTPAPKVVQPQVVEPTPLPQAAQPQAVEPTPAPQAAQPQAVEPTPAPQAEQPQSRHSNIISQTAVQPQSVAIPPQATTPQTTTPEPMPTESPVATEAVPQPVTASAVATTTATIGKQYDSSADHAATQEIESDRPYELPSISLLDTPPEQKNAYTEDVLAEMAGVLEATLKQFNIKAIVMHVSPGPVITRFELELAPGIQAKKITNLSVDLARALAVDRVRVEEVIPGNSYVGLEVPNKQRQVVYFKDVVCSKAFRESQSPLTVSLGADTSGKPQVADLMKMPHALVAGTTGSGKSVCINVMLLSMLFKASPKDLRLIMVDPKMLEMSMYEDIPHLLTPVITDMNEAENALTWAVAEMERRYQLMAALKVRKIDAFNEQVDAAIACGVPIKDPLWEPDEQVGYTHHPTLERLPFIVIVIDELADMMMVVGKQVEQLIARLTQKARAAGIHVVLATQRPSTDVLTGLIKANVPTRIAFQVSSGTDSRVIIDSVGAEKLLGHGDMLYVPPGVSHPQRLHGAFVGDAETDRITNYLRSTGEPQYVEGITRKQDPETLGAYGAAEAAETKEDADPLYEEAVQVVLETGKASISSVQRHLRIGYNRAARMIEDMQEQGIVSEPVNGVRKVLGR